MKYHPRKQRVKKSPTNAYSYVVRMCAATLTLVSIGVRAQAADLPSLGAGHADVGVAFEDGDWNLHVHAEEAEVEHEPGAVVLTVGPRAVMYVPADARYAFLGAAGSSIWVLPSVENEHLLFLGLGTEELEKGIFTDDRIRLSLKSMTGPGDFILYTLDLFGNPNVGMNSRDGIGTNDVQLLSAQSHSHANWAFTAPGRYSIGLQASGVLASTGEETASEILEYQFDVQYRPVLGLSLIGVSSLRLTWQSLEGYEYELQSAPVEPAGIWAPHAGVPRISGDGSMLSADVSRDEEARMFRLRVEKK